MAVSITLSAIFITRSRTSVGGKTYFTLFDDAMISMRYARNLAQGHGLVFTAGGARAEGYTNFLWTVWMAGLHLLHAGNAWTPFLVMITGLVVLALLVVVVHRLALETAPGQPLVATIAAWATALYYPLTFWTLRGMEVGVVAIFTATAALLTVRQVKAFSLARAIRLGIVLAAAALTRDETLVAAAVLLSFLALSVEKRHRVPAVAVPAVILTATVLIHTGARVWYYGAALPNTYTLKIVHNAVGDRVRRGLVALAALTLNELFLPLALAGLAFWSRRRALPRAALLLTMIFGAQCLYMVYVGGDAWEQFQYADRYIAPVVPFLLIVAAIGAVGLSQSSGRARRHQCQAVALIMLAVAAVQTASPLPLRFIQSYQTNFQALRTTATIGAAITFLLLSFQDPSPGDSAKAARRRARSPVPALGPGVFIALLVLCVSGAAFQDWVSNNAQYVTTFDIHDLRVGLMERQVTAPNATIAVVTLGVLPYFSERPTIDLLGKADATIAGEQPRRKVFFPGHNKWDYAYSICHLRPDLVAQLWEPTQADRSTIEGCGYQLVGHHDVYVRNDTKLVDRAALQSAVLRLEKESPDNF